MRREFLKALLGAGVVRPEVPAGLREGGQVPAGSGTRWYAMNTVDVYVDGRKVGTVVRATMERLQRQLLEEVRRG